MPHRKWDLRIKDILASIDRILEYTRNLDFEGFRSDTKTVDAVVRNFEIIGEAAKRIPREFADSHPGIPWKIMAGMRDRLIHGYDQIDIPLIWRTIVNDIPSLSRKLKEL